MIAEDCGHENTRCSADATWSIERSKATKDILFNGVSIRCLWLEKLRFLGEGYGKNWWQVKKKPKRAADDPHFKAILDAIQAKRDEERLAFRNAVDAVKDAPPLIRAEACLRFWAERMQEWGDHEAVVYLISRGNDCSRIIRGIQVNWREAVQQAVQSVSGQEKEFERKVKHDPTSFLFRFWSLFDSQELSIDATMLRAAEWCNIRGYERWWRKLEEDLREGAFSGGAHPFRLFNFCRSDFAVQNMGRAIELSLASIESLSLPRSTPWMRGDENLGYAIHDAAAIVFAHARTPRSVFPTELLHAAIDDLRKSFNHEQGAWPAFSAQPNKLSVESTAMALHALRAASVPDWSQFAEPAKAWLWSQQHADGYWFENAAPDPVWLTVLALDAIELVGGATDVTFKLDVVPFAAQLVFVAYQHSDTRWLEELKKHLGTLVFSGKIEFFSDRQIKAGREWDPEIRDKLNAARIIIPLISPNFLGSSYIQTVELPAAITRHKKGQAVVLPVLIEECDWEGLGWDGFSLAEINMLPKDKKHNLKPLRAWGNKRHEALKQVAQEIRQLIDKLS
jgi:hypothetical protein